MKFPNIHGVKLEICCKKTLKRIDQRIKLGDYLQKGLGLAVWLNIFGPSPSTMNTIFSLQQTDFETLIQAVKAVPQITPRVILTDCEGEYFKHFGKNMKLEKFWEGMINVFS